MRRRDFVALLAGGAAVAVPVAARAQQKAMPVIGYLHPGSPGPFAPFTAAFRQGLGDAGYVEGRNVAIEYRWAEGHEDRQPALAADLVGRKVDAIVTVGVSAARLAKEASSTIPVVFFTGGDPVADGLVASLARPGGNMTGVTVFGAELNPKRLELLSELVPRARAVAVLVNPNSTNAEGLSRDLQEAARAKAMQLHLLRAGSETEIDAAFASLARAKPKALIVTSNPLFFSRREQIVALAARGSVPTIYYRREFVAAGGLIGYGASYATGYRQVGAYAGKILAGANPADLPVQQPTVLELAINLKTAKALGLTVPPSLLARADEVIE